MIPSDCQPFHFPLLSPQKHLNFSLDLAKVQFSLLVVSSGCTEGDVRLTGGETVMEGRVEVCHNQTWWAVSTSYWDFNDATVVCRHLHYPANCKLCQP